MIDFLFNNYLEVTVSTSLPVAMLLFLLPILDKRYTARWRHLLWLALSVRLIIPLNLSLPKPLLEIQRAPVSDKLSGAGGMPDGGTMFIEMGHSRLTAIQVLALLWITGFAVFITCYRRFAVHLHARAGPLQAA